MIWYENNKGVVGALRGTVNKLEGCPPGRALNDETYLSTGRWVFFLCLRGEKDPGRPAPKGEGKPDVPFCRASAGTGRGTGK